MVAEILLNCFNNFVRNISFQIANQYQVSRFQEAYVWVELEFADICMQSMGHPAFTSITIYIAWIKKALLHELQGYSTTTEKFLIVWSHGNTLNLITFP